MTELSAWSHLWTKNNVETVCKKWIDEFKISGKCSEMISDFSSNRNSVEGMCTTNVQKKQLLFFGVVNVLTQKKHTMLIDYSHVHYYVMALPSVSRSLVKRKFLKYNREIGTKYKSSLWKRWGYIHREFVFFSTKVFFHQHFQIWKRT